MAQTPFLSDLTCSTHSLHDILTVWKKNDHNLPVGRVKCDKHVLGGCSYGFFVGFWQVLSSYALACYSCYTLFHQYAYAINTFMLLTVIPHSLTVDIWLMTHKVSGVLDSLSLVESNDVIMSRLRLTATSNCFPHPYWTYTKWLSTLICYPWAYGISLTQLYPHYFMAQNFEFWVTCGVKMMWLCHGWGWQSPQTAFHLHIRHIKRDWANWYAVH